MSAGVRGRLITASFADTVLPTLPGASRPAAADVRALDVWSDRREVAVGPASSIRAITDAVVVPLLRLLGFAIGVRVDEGARTLLRAVGHDDVSVPVVVVGWNEPLDRAWRAVVLDGVRADARWCFCCNGTAFRVVDAQRTWSREYLEFDLALLSREEPARALFWNLTRAEALALRPPLLERAVEASARHGVAVCRALGSGVLEALVLISTALRRFCGADPHQRFEASLTVVYRILFLLFAEARGLVPIWHPVYRDRYSVEGIVTSLLTRRRYRGVWEAILAISRLAHGGCAVGELRVTAFNGRLFAPAHAPGVDRARIGDDTMAGAVMAVSTFDSGATGARTRIAYRDLDVEQLGAVYEHVLEHDTTDVALPTDRARDARKSSGTFYTPRAVTAYLVRQTLAPLVRDRTADEILRLRVVDPAMGSGAFLVAACRFLAAAAEDALVREGTWHPGDVTPDERAVLRREIAQRCLFGVDMNPIAVQLARLSLWLATLASDKPLSFLDHHLVVGDSLVGATPLDVHRQPPRGCRSSRRPAPLPLFSATDLAPVLEHAIRTRLQLTQEPDDSAAIVRQKEKTLAALHAADAPLGRWSRVLDLWCAGWFWQRGDPADGGTFADLCDLLLLGRSALPVAATSPLLEHAADVAARHRFLHWPLAFPEVFGGGSSTASAGFDAVIGNPPWDMVRGDSGQGRVRADRREEARRFTGFVREAGIYRIESRAHVNRYQLFVDRALQLTRRGGRVGLVLPSGVATDAGAAPLRRHLFEQADVDTLTGLTNRGGIFSIHRSIRFVLLTCTAGAPTREFSCRFGISSAEDLETPPERQVPLIVTRRFLGRLSGEDDLGVPELVSPDDLRILESIAATHPWLGSASGWNVRFGRELNASDDCRSFVPFTGRHDARPVLEGKQIEPFRTSLERCRYQLAATGRSRSIPRRARLAYRDVASATNRLTLIAAIVPPRAVTTHTLFCLRTPLPADAQHVLCALLNSFVANYLVRLRVNTHVTVWLVSRLPAPAVRRGDAAFARLAHLSRTVADGVEPPERMPEYVDLQALVARLYGLRDADFAHILSTFPLIPEEIKSAALDRYNNVA